MKYFLIVEWISMGIFFIRVFLLKIQEGMGNMILATSIIIINLILITHSCKSKKMKYLSIIGWILIWMYFIQTFALGIQGGLINRTVLIGFIIITTIQIMHYHKTKQSED